MAWRAAGNIGRGGGPLNLFFRLAVFYSSFTEGFDTRDLKEAKVLLDELHA
jgi:predicted ATPase